MKFFATLLVLMLPLYGFAAFKTPAETTFLLNQGYGSTTQLGSQLVGKKLHVLKAQYDYASVAGLSGSYTLKDVDGKDAILPAGAIVTDCVIDTLTAMTSSAFPKVSLGTGLAGSVTDLKAASILSVYSGLVACIPVGTAATSIKITTQSSPKLYVLTASTTSSHALQAGKLNVLLQYLLSD